MYLMAQKLYQSDSKTSWINAFYYTHGGEDVEGMSWCTPDVAMIADKNPGRIIGALIDHYPGGHPVDSYIDIVARDETPSDVVRDVLDEIRRELPASKGHRQWSMDQVAVRVYFGKHIQSENIDSFDAFRDRIDQLLRNPRACSWKERKGRLVVEVSSTQDGLQYKLSSQSADKLVRLKGKRWIVPVISVKHVVKDDFESRYGDLRETILETVTGLDRTKLLKEGGVIFRGMSPEIEDWEWPPIPAGD